MVPDFPTFIKAALLVAAILWLKEAFGQLSEDIDGFRTADRSEQRWGYMASWSISGLILFAVCGYLVSLLSSAVSG